MKIALFHTTLPESGRKLGGVEVTVHRLAEALTRRGDCQVTVFSLTPAPDQASYAHVHLFPGAPGLYRRRLARLFVLPLVLNFVRGFDSFDVLHLHGDDWFFVNRRCPTVRTLHGSALQEARSASSWKRRLMQYIVYPLEHMSARLATVGTAVGTETAALYRLSQVVDNGVDLKRFHPGPKAEQPTLLFIGTWEGRKRGRFLYETFIEQILPKVPEARLQMVTDQCPDHPSVDWIRFPSDEVLARLYRSAWVFAYPSAYEGFGIPYIEALASGTVVVTSPNSGARYVLDEGQYGRITPDETFADALLDVLQDPVARVEEEQRGLERAHRFSWSSVAEQHYALYSQAIEHPLTPQT